MTKPLVEFGKVTFAESRGGGQRDLLGVGFRDLLARRGDDPVPSRCLFCTTSGVGRFNFHTTPSRSSSFNR